MPKIAVIHIAALLIGMISVGALSAREPETLRFDGKCVQILNSAEFSNKRQNVLDQAQRLVSTIEVIGESEENSVIRIWQTSFATNLISDLRMYPGLMSMIKPSDRTQVENIFTARLNFIHVFFIQLSDELTRNLVLVRNPAYRDQLRIFRESLTQISNELKKCRAI